MTKQIEAMKLALEALEWDSDYDKRQTARAALREALAEQPAQQPAQQGPVDLVDGEGNPLTLMQAIDHAVKAAETNGAHRLNKILVAAKKALAEQPAPVQQEPTRRTHEDRN